MRDGGIGERHRLVRLLKADGAELVEVWTHALAKTYGVVYERDGERYAIVLVAIERPAELILYFLERIRLFYLTSILESFKIE